MDYILSNCCRKRDRRPIYVSGWEPKTCCSFKNPNIYFFNIKNSNDTLKNFGPIVVLSNLTLFLLLLFWIEIVMSSVSIFNYPTLLLWAYYANIKQTLSKKKEWIKRLSKMVKSLIERSLYFLMINKFYLLLVACYHVIMKLSEF